MKVVGLGLTRGFLEAGFNVVANSRNLTGSGTLTQAGSLSLVDGDVGEPATARTLVDRANHQFGSVDLVINNAGIFVPKPFTEYTAEDFLRVVSTNLAGFFFVTQEAARHMRGNGGGQILTITTTLAQQPVAGINAALTNLTKGGLNSATRALAIEYAAEGIRVNAIAPGIVDTPMHKPGAHETLKRLHPIARLGTIDEIVDAALFLVRASFITGEVLYVDGGANAGKWGPLRDAHSTTIRRISMPFDMTAALFVTDQDKYAQYRAQIAPLLHAAGAAFRYDFEIAATLKSEADHQINRVFILRFPDRGAKERFFANPRYLEVRARLFSVAVERMTIIDEHGE